MNHDTDPDPQPDPCADHARACPIGLLASTLMLMSQLAAPEAGAQPLAPPGASPAAPPGASPAAHPGASPAAPPGAGARRIAHNLRALQQHDAIPPALRQVAGRLVGRWTALALQGQAVQDAQTAFGAHAPRPGTLLH